MEITETPKSRISQLTALVDQTVRKCRATHDSHTTVYFLHTPERKIPFFSVLDDYSKTGGFAVTAVNGGAKQILFANGEWMDIKFSVDAEELFDSVVHIAKEYETLSGRNAVVEKRF